MKRYQSYKSARFSRALCFIALRRKYSAITIQSGTAYHHMESKTSKPMTSPIRAIAMVLSISALIPILCVVLMGAGSFAVKRVAII